MKEKGSKNKTWRPWTSYINDWIPTQVLGESSLRSFLNGFLRLIPFGNLRSKKCGYGTKIRNDLNGDLIVELFWSSIINLEKLGQYKRSVLLLREASKSQIWIVLSVLQVIPDFRVEFLFQALIE